MADKPENRSADTKFKKGQSGNPGGRPKAVKEALEAFRDSNDLLRLRMRLMEIAMSDNYQAANAAIKEWHDRAYGKPAQAITGEDGGPVKVESAAVLELVKRLAGE